MARHCALIAASLAAFLFGCFQPGWADSVSVPSERRTASAGAPKIALIIDDLGNAGAAGRRTVRLDGPVACAILPHTPFARLIASQANASGKEVLLHLPLQPVELVQPANIGVIGIDNTRGQMRRILAADLQSVPFIVGVNSHMGSLLTRHPGHMGWLMAELKVRGDLFFIDSYTSSSSVALQLALEHGIPAARRDVFLDNDLEPKEISRAFERLKSLARQHGSAIGIGHPYKETLTYLEYALPRLIKDGYELVPVATLLTGPADKQL
jgi:polysaccharide deacetylase 2 family uncharacterized protein YibQ